MYIAHFIIVFLCHLGEFQGHPHFLLKIFNYKITITRKYLVPLLELGEKILADYMDLLESMLNQ